MGRYGGEWTHHSGKVRKKYAEHVFRVLFQLVKKVRLDFIDTLAGAPFGTPALLSLYFLKLSFRDTLRLNTRCSAELSRLSRQK